MESTILNTAEAGVEVVGEVVTNPGFLGHVANAARSAGSSIANGAVKAGGAVGAAASNNPIVATAVIGVVTVAGIWGTVKLVTNNRNKKALAVAA